MSKVICLDTETTGLHNDDEILQISMIDENGIVLLNSLVKPHNKTSWPDAEKVHGIKPSDVENALFIEDLIPTIERIIHDAEIIIGYNIGFDLNMLSHVLPNYGVLMMNKNVEDVMFQFAEIYGEWSEFRGAYKWQKLTTAAKYYRYEFTAHDALEDVKATLFVWNEIKLDWQERNNGRTRA